MSKKKQRQSKSSQENPAFATQPMLGPDGQPVAPARPDMHGPAFATQIVRTTPELLAAAQQDSPGSDTTAPPTGGSAFATQIMSDEAGQPVAPGAPELNNPAFATQIIPPGEDGSPPPSAPPPSTTSSEDSAFATQAMIGDDGTPVAPPAPDQEDSAFATQILRPSSDQQQADIENDSQATQQDISSHRSPYSTQPMQGEDGQPVAPGDPEKDNPAFATQISGQDTDSDVPGRKPPSVPDELSQTLPATGEQMAKVSEVAQTRQHILTRRDRKDDDEFELEYSPTNRSGRSTWNLRIRQRGIAGHVSGIINQIPEDPSLSSGLQSALVSDPGIAEYEVLGELGAGAMGVVYQARQTSLNRDVAIKSLKPTAKSTDHDQAMFVSEAVVTSNLVHPNIVPIHDLGRTEDGKLFYAMKQVSGTPWNETIRDNSLEDNLDIFMKMCDAVAYAHSRGVINRDLKPENVVVGDFGDVSVLDWGLAITTDAFERKDSVVVSFRGGGGTPVYMAPELAHDDISGIGTFSDIYLLGAILFEILEGFPPHLLREAWEAENPQNQLQSVIFAVFNNRIEEDVENEGELMEIARRAMRTDPAERWATVEEFQDAIREYRITGRAEELMHEADAEQAATYEKYQAAVALYDDALRKWPDNERAVIGDRKARLAYAELAHKKGDIDLGLQVLPAGDDPEFISLRSKLKRTQKARTVVKTTWIMLFLAAVGLSVWLVSTNRELLNAEQALAQKTSEAQEQSRIATEKTQEAEAQSAIAARERAAAAEEKRLADAARQEAVAQTELADRAREEVQELADSVRVARLEVTTQMQLASAAREDAEAERKLADAARDAADRQKKLADTARKTAEEQAMLAKVATEQAEQQKEQAELARKEALEQTDLAKTAKEEAAAQKKLADQQTQLAAAAEQDKLRALKEAEKTRIEGRLEQVDAKMEIRKYDDVVKLVDQALQEFQSIADQPDLLELLAKKKQEAERLTGNTSARLDGKTERAAASPDGATLVVSTWNDNPTVTVFHDVDGSGIASDDGFTLQPRGRTVRDVKVSRDGRVLSVIGRSQTSRNFFHQLLTRQDAAYIEVASSEFTSRRPPKCLLSPDGVHAYLITSGLTGIVTVYDCTVSPARVIRRQILDESTETFPAIHDAVLLPDESALIVATREGCRSIGLQWSDTDVQITHLRRGQAFNNVFPAPRGLSRLGTGGARDRFDTRQLALSADGSMLALISGTRVIALPRSRTAGAGDFPYVSPEQLDGNGIIDTDYGTRIAAAFSTDGNQLVTAGRRYIQVWDKTGDTWKLSTVNNLYDGNSIAGHSRSVELVSFIPGGEGRLISVSGDGVVRTWNPQTYAEYVDGMSGVVEAFRQGAMAATGSDPSASLPRKKSWSTGVARADDLHSTAEHRPGSRSKGRWLLTGADEQAPADRARRIRQARRVFSAEFSQDSERVVIGANDLAAHSFESRTASRTGTMSTQPPRDTFFAPERNNFLEGHIPEIVSVQFLPPNGELLVTLDYFGSISVWDARDDEDGIGFEKSRPVPSEPVTSSDPERPYEVDDPSCEITVSSDGQWIMAGGVRNDGNVDIRQSSDECFVALWKTEDVKNSATPRPWRVLKGQHPSRVTAAAFSPDGRLALTAGRRGRLVLWDFQNDQVVAAKDDTHGSDGVSGAFFVSDTQFITAGFDGRVYRWTIGPDGLSEEILSRGEGQKDPDFIVRLRASADRQQFITSDLTKSTGGRSYRLKLNVWSSTDGWQQTLPAGIDAPPDDLGRSYRHDVSWSMDGRDVLFVHDEQLLIFNTQTWKPRTGFMLPPGSRAVRGTFAPTQPGEPTRIATFDGRFAHLWDVDTGEHVAEFRSHGPFVRAGYSSDRRFLITGSESIRVFNADESSPDHGRPIFRLSRRVTGRSVFADARFSPAPNDHRFATVDRLGTVRLWDWKPEEGPPTSASFAASGPQDMQAEYALPNVVCWSPQAQYLAAIQLGQVMLWALEPDGPRPLRIDYPRGIAPVDLIMNDLDFSSDGTRLTAGGSYEDESFALVWTLDENLATPTASIVAEEYHSSYDDNADGLTGITSIGFDDRRREIITGGADSRVLRWQVRRPDPDDVIELPYIASMLGGPRDDFRAPHTAAVSAVDIAGSGSILTADEAGYFVIWPAAR